MNESMESREILHTHSNMKLTAYNTLEDWERKRSELRKRILFSAGLMPFPDKCELNARITDKKAYKDFTVEKVIFTSRPGYEVTGNLYRPLNRSGRVPAILNPHGHWLGGRLEYSNDDAAYESPDSVQEPVRNANLAMMGYVSFSYDMVGYVDSMLIPHRYRSESHQLWGCSLLGLQLWNSIRALDFLESLPDVDSNRIGCTGASGGATQSILLGAVDDRIKLMAPVNMISAHMQGGCECENAPGLRLGTNNVEIAALFAPRPMLVTGCTGDWTWQLPEVEYPAIRDIYALYGAEDEVSCFFDDAPHNYNRVTREAVYRWFGNNFSGMEEKWEERRVDFGDALSLRVHQQASTVQRLNNPQEYAKSFFTQQRQERSFLVRRLQTSCCTEGRQILLNGMKFVFGLAEPSVDQPVRFAARVHTESSKSSTRLAGAALIFKKEDQQTETVFGEKSALCRRLNEMEKAYDDCYEVIIPSAVLRKLPFQPEDDPYFPTYNYAEAILLVQEVVRHYHAIRQNGYALIDLYGFAGCGFPLAAALPFLHGANRVHIEVAIDDFHEDADYMTRFFVPHFCAFGGFRTAKLLSGAAEVCLLV